MTIEVKGNEVCVKCLADDVAVDVLANFSEMHPDIKMSWHQWMDLSCLIEETIKLALGEPTEIADQPAPVTVQ